MSRRAFPPLLLLLAYGLFIFSPLIADPDLWGHVRFGLDTLRTGQIVRPDPYSYLTAGQPWVNHEWLSEAIQAFAYARAGAGGIIALNLALALLTIGLLYARLVARGMGEWAAALLTAGFAWMLRPGVLNARPQVWTYLMMALLVLVIEGAERRREDAGKAGGRGGAALPLQAAAILAVWANLHGGVLAGLGVVALWGAGRLAEAAVARRSWRGEIDVILTLLVAPLALLVNPYGAGLGAFLLRTTTVPRPEIVDWQAVTLTDPWGQVWLAGVVVTAAAIVVDRRPLRLPLLLPLAALALLPLLSIRHIPLSAVAAPVLAADYFAGAWERLRARMPRLTQDLSGFGNLTGLVGAALLTLLAAPRLSGILIDPRVADFPARAVAVMQAAGVEGNLAVEFNWGEYVIWHLGPRVQVSVDGRRETVYPEAVYRENLDWMLGVGAWDRLIDRPETDMALVDKARPVYGLMREKDGWTLAYEDDLAALFVRDGSTWLERISAVAPPDWPANGAGLAFPVE